MAKCLVGAAGGLPAEDKAKLTPGNIKAGVTFFEGTPRAVAGTFTADATATADQILSGRTAYVGGKKVTGALKVLYAGGCRTGTYAGGIRWNGASYVYEGHSYFYLTGQPKMLYVQYEATPYVKVDGKTYGPRPMSRWTARPMGRDSTTSPRRRPTVMWNMAIQEAGPASASWACDAARKGE